ncbi:MAG: hypothetical protein KDC74_07515 [Flavobacteriaceae bacterium]|nr:hypothetical protein [Flavobacteriaceae bacterium]
MKEDYKLNPIIYQVREYTFKILDEHSKLNVYTTISKLYRIETNIKKIVSEDNLNEIDFNSLFLANCIYTIQQATINLRELDFTEIDKNLYNIKGLDKIITGLKVKFNIENLLLEKANLIVIQSLPDNNATVLEAQILSDAIVMDFADNNGRERLKSLYEELILKDIHLSKTNWYDTLIPLIGNYKAYTNYGKDKVKPCIENLRKSLKGEREELENKKDLLLKKELKISDKEIKKLKKDLSKIKDRDDRGIQTLFRTTSKNHYTLNEMVDRKAKIMITVNSIILSLFLGGFIGKLSSGLNVYIPILIFSIANLISITFAIISIMPNKTQGNFTEEEVRSKKGNLLYFGNFYNMHYRDFEWGFLQMLNDKDYLYTSMIRDIYYQGQILHKKYTYIRISLFIFLLGLGLSIVTHLFFINL